MSALPRQVDHALSRWTDRGLLDAELAKRLRAEAEAHSRSAGTRRTQYLLAVTGGTVLVMAAAVLAGWSWPLLGPGGRAVVLAAAGALAHLAGRAFERRERWLPAAYLLQTAGLLILLWAYMASEPAWPDGSLGGVVVGAAALATPIFLAPWALGRNRFMPAVHAALSFAFLAVFLSRATPLSADAIVWVLDGVLAVVAAALVVRLRSVGAGSGDALWALPALVGAAYAALVLVLATALGPLDLEADAAWAADAWLVVVTGLTLWGIHGAPPPLQRDWYEGQLALCVLLAVPMGFATTLGALDSGPELAALGVAAVGAAGLRYGVRRDSARVAMAGSVAVLAGTWYYSVERGRALGAAVALAVTAALLFWVSGRIGARAEGE